MGGAFKIFEVLTIGTLSEYGIIFVSGSVDIPFTPIDILGGTVRGREICNHIEYRCYNICRYVKLYNKISPSGEYLSLIHI